MCEYITVLIEDPESDDKFIRYIIPAGNFEEIRDRLAKLELP